MYREKVLYEYRLLLFLKISFSLMVIFLLFGSIQAGDKFEHFTEFPEVKEDKVLSVARTRMRLMTKKEHPKARMERIAHDYVYAEKGYKDTSFLLRMKADGLTIVESFTDTDGVAAMVLHDDKNPGKYIVAFRGTDTHNTTDNKHNASEVLWSQPVGTRQYVKHRKVWSKWAKKYGASGSLAVTGHSRGGGLAALFTAEHSGKVEQLTIFQAPGQFLLDHKRFRRNATKWPKDCTLVVAASDLVQLPGVRHVGEPKVIIGLAKDMGPGKLFGHKSYLLQNAFMADWRGNLYRNPEDGLKLGIFSYYDYARFRIGAIADPNKFYAWNGAIYGLDLTDSDQISANWYTWTKLFLEVEKVGAIDLLANATLRFLLLQKEINQQNQIGEIDDLPEGNIGSDLKIFDHLLPPEFHSFEKDFYNIFKQLIEQDLKEVESGIRSKPKMFLNQNIMAFIQVKSVEEYLDGLKDAYQSFPIVELDEINKVSTTQIKLSGVDAKTLYGKRIRLLKAYYETQKQALVILEEMFTAGHQLIRAKVEEGAARMVELVRGIETYLLNLSSRTSVNSKAKNPPKSKGSGQAAQNQAIQHVQQVSTSSINIAINWSVLSRAYEEIHEDLFVDAISYTDYTIQVNVWQQLVKQYWDALGKLILVSSTPITGQYRLADERKLFNQEIEKINNSFKTQAQNKLSKLDLLYKRYKNASIRNLLQELREEVTRVEDGINQITKGASDWYNANGKIEVINERQLSDLAPTGVKPNMSWLPGVIQQSKTVSQAAMKLNNTLSAYISGIELKVEREQDYVLSLLELYVFESAKRNNVRQYYVAKGGIPYPDGMVLRENVYNKWIEPLSDTVLELLRLQELLDSDYVQVPSTLGSIADERSKEIAYFGKSFEELVKKETQLKQEYLAVRSKLRQGVGPTWNPNIPISEGSYLGPHSASYSSPQLIFNQQPICIVRYICANELTTDNYLYDLLDQWRIWKLPEGDTKEANPSKRFGSLISFIDKHAVFAEQFSTALSEIKKSVQLTIPLHAEYEELVKWRKQLETAFFTARNSKPLLSKAFTWFSGKLPASYSLTDANNIAFGELHFDYNFHTSRLVYMQNTFIPKATKFIADITNEEQQLWKGIETRIKEATKIIEEIERNPNISIKDRDSLANQASSLLAYGQKTHWLINKYAPFMVDYWSHIKPLKDRLFKATLVIPKFGGLMKGLITDKRSAAKLSGVTIRFMNRVNGSLPSSVTFVTNNKGRFTDDHFPEGAWNYNVNKSGYQLFSGSMQVYTGINKELIIPLVPISSNATYGTLQISLLRYLGTPSTSVTITITDRRGKVLARGEGPHKLNPGEYIVNTYGQYLETYPSSKHFRLWAGDRKVIEVRIWQDEEEDDNNGTGNTNPPIQEPDKKVFTKSHVMPCSEKKVFVKSLYHCIFEREPTNEEITEYTNKLQNGLLRGTLVKKFLLSIEMLEGLGWKDRNFIVDAHQAIYSREPTASEIKAWSSTNRSIASVTNRSNTIDEMFKSREHLDLIEDCASLWHAPSADKDLSNALGTPCGTDQAFIFSLFQSILERDPKKKEVDNQIKDLKNGLSRKEMVIRFFKFGEYLHKKKGGSEAYRDAYQAVLAREPSTKEIQTFPRTYPYMMAKGLFDTEEYRNLCSNQEDHDETNNGKTDTATEKEAYERYVAAYNKLTQLMAENKGDTPESQRAFKKYKYEKKRYEKIIKDKKPVKDHEGTEKEEVDDHSQNTNISTEELYKKYIAAYKRLTQMAIKTPISDPPELKKISDKYHKILNQYNRTQDRRIYQEYIAAHNHLMSMVSKVKIIAPFGLKQAQDDYFLLKEEYKRKTK